MYPRWIKRILKSVPYCSCLPGTMVMVDKILRIVLALFNYPLVLHKKLCCSKVVWKCIICTVFIIPEERRVWTIWNYLKRSDLESIWFEVIFILRVLFYHLNESIVSISSLINHNIRWFILLAPLILERPFDNLRLLILIIETSACTTKS